MLHYASSIEKYNLHATDGELGKVKDWYVDDRNWVVRYAVVDTQKWLPGKKVVLSPSAFTGIDEENEEVAVRHDKETVKNSPPLEEETGTLGGSYEAELNQYYGWAPYWIGSDLWGQTSNPMVQEPMSDYPQSTTNKIDELSSEADYTLREVDELKENFTVFIKNKRLGKIEDLLIDEENWKIRYFVIDSTADFPEGSYLLSPDWLESVDWTEHTIYFDLNEEDLAKGADNQEKKKIGRDEEREIYKKYYKSTYWE